MDPKYISISNGFQYSICTKKTADEPWRVIFWKSFQKTNLMLAAQTQVSISLCSVILKLRFSQLVESICQVNHCLLRELFPITSSVETYSNHKSLTIICCSHLAYFTVLHKSIYDVPFNQFAPPIINISQ